jgi:hypothetical protein
MSKAEDYRQKAADCVTMAAKSTDMRMRGVLLHMADVWTKLAAEDQPIVQQQQQQTRPKPDRE